MSQSSFSITNLSRTLFRTAVNTALQALASSNSGASAPSETYAHMWWVDTTSGWVKQRNAANSDWEKKFPIAKARVDVASAATLDLDANTVTSDYLRITGTTTVTAVTLAAGQRRIAVAGGAFQLTNSANLIVQGGADFTTTAGDLLMFMGEAGGVVRVGILKSDGTPVAGGFVYVMSSVPTSGTYTAGDIVLESTTAGRVSGWKRLTTGSAHVLNTDWVYFGGPTLATSQATTSGTAIDFTGIPSWVKKITVMFDNVSLNGASEILVQLGDSGGIENTVYNASGVRFTASAVSASTTNSGFPIKTADATYNASGSIILSLMDASTNKWACQGVLSGNAAVINYIVAGTKSLSSTLDRVRIASSNGTDPFDTGIVNIQYEG